MKPPGRGAIITGGRGTTITPPLGGIMGAIGGIGPPIFTVITDCEGETTEDLGGGGGGAGCGADLGGGGGGCGFGGGG